MESPIQMSATGGRALVSSAVIIGLGLVIAAGVGAYGEIEARRNESTTGASFYGKAEREVEADTAKLSLVLTRTASSTEAAAEMIEKDHETLREAVSKAGISDPDYSFHQINTNDYYDDYYGSYTRGKVTASQTVVIESKSAAALGELGQKAAVILSKNGLLARTDRVEFSYSKLDDVQKELQIEAVNDAKQQAKDVLGNQLGALRSLERPTITVRPLNAGDTDYYGAEQTSLKKKVTVSIYATYRIK